MSFHENISDSKVESVLGLKYKYDVGTFSFAFAYSVLLFNFLLSSNLLLVVPTMNVEMHENLINVLTISIQF